jgi:hypothetical protein
VIQCLRDVPVEAGTERSKTNDQATETEFSAGGHRCITEYRRIQTPGALPFCFGARKKVTFKWWEPQDAATFESCFAAGFLYPFLPQTGDRNVGAGALDGPCRSIETQNAERKSKKCGISQIAI